MQFIPNPIKLIKDYFGVCDDCDFKYICPHIRGDNCYIEEKSSGNSKLHAQQILIFQKMIEILRRSSPLCPLNQQSSFSESGFGLKLCTGSYEASEEELDSEINPNDVFVLSNASNTAARNAAILTSIFYDRIKPQILTNPVGESYHRNQLAWALERHLEMNLLSEGEKEIVNSNDSLVELEILKPEKLVVIKEDKSQETIKPRRYSSPTSSLGRSEIKPSSLKTSDGKKSSSSGSRFQFHLSLQDMSRSSGSPSPKRSETKASPTQKFSSEKEALRDSLLKLLSIRSLENCRSYWIQGKHSNKHNGNSASWDEGEYGLIEKHQILEHPMMHQLVQYELAKDIFNGLYPHKLMQDIDRNFDHIDKNHHGGLKVYERKNIFETKAEHSEKYNVKVTHFYYLLKRWMGELSTKNPKEQEVILNLWTECAKAQLNDLSDESFVSAGESFYKKLDRDDPYSKKVISLLALLRQQFYIYPVDVVHAVTYDVPLDYLFDDLQRLMRFDFKDGNVEFCTSLKVIPAKEAIKWKNSEIKCSGVEIEVINTMRSNNTDLTSWTSKVEINISVIKDLVNKNYQAAKQFIIDPLKAVGFTVDVKFVESSFTRSY